MFPVGFWLESGKYERITITHVCFISLIYARSIVLKQSPPPPPPPPPTPRSGIG